MPKLKVLDLFSGIGGFSLGLERTGGFETVGFCESDEFCRRVLRKHWPTVQIAEDVRALDGSKLDHIDVITGGFPCQDISFAGYGMGITGSRSELWFDQARIIGEARPRYAIVENVAALLHRGLGVVLGCLAEIGYDAEWHCIQAADVGAPHLRDRAWIVAYPAREQVRSAGQSWCAIPTDAEGNGRGQRRPRRPSKRSARPQHEPRSPNTADAESQFGRRRSGEPQDWPEPQGHLARDAAHAARMFRPSLIREQQDRNLRGCWQQHWRERLGEIGRMDDGVSRKLDRLRSLGNAAVPQVVEVIGRAILDAEGC